MFHFLPKRRFASLFLLCLVASANALEPKQEVQNVFYQWCKAIGTAKGNPEAVVKFYAPEAILLPTLSGDFLINEKNGFDSYFRKLTSYPNIRCKPKTMVIYVHDLFATNSGFYEFIYSTKDGKTITIPARFTFIYKNINNRWLITDHHSSKTP